MAPQTLLQSGAAPRVEEGTALSQSAVRAELWQEEVAACTVDPKVWTGAFATNVWGGRFEIDTLLGKGGQGTTFAGVDKKTGARVAVKMLDLSSVEDWKRVELFQREINTLKSLEHSAIPAFIDVIEDTDSGARALVMTQVRGDNFADALKENGPFSESELWRVLVDVVDVLAFLHGQSTSIVHRDIKPSNLIRRPDGGISVVDFGGVTHSQGSGGSTIVGTFGYMAPEQLYGDSTPATDLYALGATMLNLATGKEPEDLPRDGLAIDVDKAAPHLSEPLRALLKGLVAPDPKNRPASAGVVAMDLNAAYEDTKTPKQKRSTQAKRARSASDAQTDAQWPPPREDAQEEAREAVKLVEGVVTMIMGIGGTVLAVALGEVLIPLILGLLTAFTDGATTARLRRAQTSVRASTKTIRKGLDKATERGALALESVSYRKKKRRLERRDHHQAPKPPSPPRHRGRKGRR